MIRTKLKKNKNSQSEIVSYVLLIVITLAVAAGVYAWLRFYAPSEKEAEKCSDEVSMGVNDYNCSSSGQTLSLVLENRGLFNINGFFIRASNDSSKLPYLMLNKTDDPGAYGSLLGRYDFTGERVLKPGNIFTANFSYTYTNLTSIKRIQIQPFTVGTRAKTLLMCKQIVDINIDGC